MLARFKKDEENLIGSFTMNFPPTGAPHSYSIDPCEITIKLHNQPAAMIIKCARYQVTFIDT